MYIWHEKTLALTARNHEPNQTSRASISISHKELQWKQNITNINNHTFITSCWRELWLTDSYTLYIITISYEQAPDLAEMIIMEK